MQISNCHERVVAAPPERIAALIADFGPIWPTQIAPAPLARGHGRYDTGLMVREEIDRPGAARAFRVVGPDELQGEHWFEIEPAGDAPLLRHNVHGRATGHYEQIWQERIKPVHDLILEALLDNVEAAAAD